MNDTFASKKICQDDMWPWGDDKKKNAHETTKKHCFFPGFFFLATPWKIQKTLRIFGRRGAAQNGWRVQNGHFAEITSFAKHYVFRCLAAAKRSRLICGPPRGTFLYRACSAETFFGFWRPFLSASSPKGFYHIKIVVSALWRYAKTSHNLGISWVNLRPPMG